MLEQSLTEFTEVLESKAAVPGGGGASALCGALGTALGHMVGELTVGKKKYADVEDEIREMMGQAEDLRQQLLSCIEEDAKAFEPLSKAYAIPKDDPTRESVMEQCLKDAAGAPMKIMELCGQSIELLKVFGEKGSVIAISDAATGAALAEAALKGAAINVRVNTRLMKDRDYAKSLDAKVAELLERYTALAEEIYSSVTDRLS